jgi:hypothetical protein
VSELVLVRSLYNKRYVRGTSLFVLARARTKASSHPHLGWPFELRYRPYGRALLVQTPGTTAATDIFGKLLL